MNMIGIYLANPAITELEENRRALQRDLELRRQLREFRIARRAQRRAQLFAFVMRLRPASRRTSRSLDRLTPASRDSGC